MKEIENLCNALDALPLTERRDWDLRLKQHGIPKGVDKLVTCLRSSLADSIAAPRKDTVAPKVGQKMLRPVNGSYEPEAASEPEPAAEVEAEA